MTAGRGEQPPGGTAVPERAARWERVARRVAAASAREHHGQPGPLTLELTEALLIAQDLFALGRIHTEPRLDWGIADVGAALAPWSVRVVPDGTVTGRKT